MMPRIEGKVQAISWAGVEYAVNGIDLDSLFDADSEARESLEWALQAKKPKKIKGLALNSLSREDKSWRK